MKKGIFILGTDTDVGKTFASAVIMQAFINNNLNIGYFKPVSSGVDKLNGIEVPLDLSYIKKVTKFQEETNIACPYSFKNPISPHLASEIENKKIEPKVIIEKYLQLKEKYNYLIVEGCGGIAVPLISDKYYIYDLMKDLNLEAFLVAKAGVGTINHTLLTINWAKSFGIKIKAIIINKYQGEFFEEDNVKMIQKITNIPIVLKIPIHTIRKQNLPQLKAEEFAKIKNLMSVI